MSEVVEETPIFDPEKDKLYSTTEVAEMFAVTPETVRDWITEGKLKAIRLDRGHYRVPRSFVLAFANKRFNIDEPVSG